MCKPNSQHWRVGHKPIHVYRFCSHYPFDSTVRLEVLCVYCTCYIKYHVISPEVVPSPEKDQEDGIVKRYVLSENRSGSFKCKVKP